MRSSSSSRHVGISLSKDWETKFDNLSAVLKCYLKTLRVGSTTFLFANQRPKRREWTKYKYRTKPGGCVSSESRACIFLNSTDSCTGTAGVLNLYYMANRLSHAHSQFKPQRAWHTTYQVSRAVNSQNHPRHRPDNSKWNRGNDLGNMPLLGTKLEVSFAWWPLDQSCHLQEGHWNRSKTF